MFLFYAFFCKKFLDLIPLYPKFFYLFFVAQKGISFIVQVDFILMSVTCLICLIC